MMLLCHAFNDHLKSGIDQIFATKVNVYLLRRIEFLFEFAICGSVAPTHVSFTLVDWIDIVLQLFEIKYFTIRLSIIASPWTRGTGGSARERL